MLRFLSGLFLTTLLMAASRPALAQQAPVPLQPPADKEDANKLQAELEKLRAEIQNLEARIKKEAGEDPKGAKRPAKGVAGPRAGGGKGKLEGEQLKMLIERLGPVLEAEQLKKIIERRGGNVDAEQLKKLNLDPALQQKLGLLPKAADEKKPEDKKPEDNKQDDRKAEDNKPEDKKLDEKKPDAKKPGEIQALEAQVKALEAQLADAQVNKALRGVKGGGNGNILPIFRAPGMLPPEEMPPPAPQKLELIPGERQEYPTSYAGAVRVRLLPPESVNMKSKEGEALLVFQVVAEPRLRMVKIQGLPTIARAINDVGQTLVPAELQPADAPANPELGRARDGRDNAGGAMIVAVPLKLGDKQAKNLKELAGTLTLEVQLPAEPAVTIDEVLKAQNQTVKSKKDDILLTFKGIEKLEDGGYRVRYEIEDANAKGLNGLGGNGNVRIGQIGGNGNVRIVVNGQEIGGNGGPASMHSPELLDANGAAYQSSRPTSNGFNLKNGVASRAFTVDFHPRAGQGEPSRLQLSAPNNANIAVPFNFKNIPLP